MFKVAFILSLKFSVEGYLLYSVVLVSNIEKAAEKNEPEEWESAEIDKAKSTITVWGEGSDQQG